VLTREKIRHIKRTYFSVDPNPKKLRYGIMPYRGIDPPPPLFLRNDWTKSRESVQEGRFPSVEVSALLSMKLIDKFFIQSGVDLFQGLLN
jgi:hypothetical protein